MNPSEEFDNAAALAPESFWKRYVATIAARLERMPWLLPLLSFGWGWLSFAMVRRGEEFARLIGSGRAEDLRVLARKLSTQAKAHA